MNSNRSDKKRTKGYRGGFLSIFISLFILLCLLNVSTTTQTVEAAISNDPFYQATHYTTPFMPMNIYNVVYDFFFMNPNNLPGSYVSINDAITEWREELKKDYYSDTEWAHGNYDTWNKTLDLSTYLYIVNAEKATYDLYKNQEKNNEEFNFNIEYVMHKSGILQNMTSVNAGVIGNYNAGMTRFDNINTQFSGDYSSIYIRGAVDYGEAYWENYDSSLNNMLHPRYDNWLYTGEGEYLYISEGTTLNYISFNNYTSNADNSRWSITNIDGEIISGDKTGDNYIHGGIYPVTITESNYYHINCGGGLGTGGIFGIATIPYQNGGDIRPVTIFSNSDYSHTNFFSYPLGDGDFYYYLNDQITSTTAGDDIYPGLLVYANGTQTISFRETANGFPYSYFTDSKNLNTHIQKLLNKVYTDSFSYYQALKNSGGNVVPPIVIQPDPLQSENLTYEELMTRYIAYLKAQEEFYKSNQWQNNTLKTINITTDKLLIRGAIFDNGTMIADHTTVFTPAIYGQSMVLEVGKTVNWTMAGYVVIFGNKTALSDQQYNPMRLDYMNTYSGMSMYIDEMWYDKAPVASYTLQVTSIDPFVHSNTTAPNLPDVSYWWAGLDSLTQTLLIAGVVCIVIGIIMASLGGGLRGIGIIITFAGIAIIGYILYQQFAGGFDWSKLFKWMVQR